MSIKKVLFSLDRGPVWARWSDLQCFGRASQTSTFFSSQNAKDQKIRYCATAPGDFLNHTHFASCYSLQQQNITKATERILAAENYDNSKYRISFVCRSEINAMSLKGILKKHPVFGASPKLVGALSKLISILFLRWKRFPNLCAVVGTPLPNLILTLFYFDNF